MAGTARRPVAGSTVRGTFDMWATNGRAEKMELEHSRAVAARLASEDLSSPFRFLEENVPAV